ncbi:MAG: hypothetical protein RL456_84 [Pseudomonadota bacterium]|jgi:4-hydroxybenzoate polyprenyltransferase
MTPLSTPPPATAPAGLLARWAALMRPHQWIKNGFVLIGIVFAHRWTDRPSVIAATLALAAFCAMASAVYIYNDLVDAEADRRHPVKRDRPIASGAVPVWQARMLAGVLAALGLGLAGAVSLTALELVACYGALNLAYTHRLKHMVILDVFTISLGFMLRILTGTVGLGIQPSSWLMLCGLMITLFLGFAKRRSELLANRRGDARTREVLRAYQPEVLDQFLAVTAGAAVLSYALYTLSPETVAVHRTDKLVYTLPFIVYGIFRYLYLLHGHGGGQDTARDLLADRHLLVTLALWLASTLLILA